MWVLNISCITQLEHIQNAGRPAGHFLTTLPLWSLRSCPFQSFPQYFHMSVILLFDHGPQGSAGLILNRCGSAVACCPPPRLLLH